MREMHARRAIELVLGHCWWRGADAAVWRMGRYVIKLCCVSPKRWSSMRLLMKRQGPFVQHIDMRVVGRDGVYIVGLIVQPYISTGHRTHDGQPMEASWTHVPKVWHDGVDVWTQFDDDCYNAVDGRWVDLAAVHSVPLNPYIAAELGLEVSRPVAA